MRYLVLLVLLQLSACSPQGDGDVQPDVHTEAVSYEVDGVTLQGYLAYDKNVEGARLGVIVVHEWWGHNDYARSRAEMLAELGYSALALDMYGDGKLAEHPDQAMMFSAEIAQNLPVGEKRFKAALDLLKSQPSTDPERMAAIGYCFGGSVVLHEARLGTDLDAVVSFHGGLGGMVEAAPQSITSRIQIHTGADDPFVPAEAVDAFRLEMDAAGADYEVFSYEGAVHSFTNPDADTFAVKFEMPVAYDAVADQSSWLAMQKLFNEVFEGGSE
jgi:dienelactone hydrolase